MHKSQIARLEGFVIKEAEDFFRHQGFIPLFPPKIVRASGACENIDTLFEVSVDKNHRWFDSNAYLSQTGQLYLEAMVPALKKVYCLGPSFRAEPKVDTRHLTEFTMLEIEFAGNFEELLSYEESLIYHFSDNFDLLMTIDQDARKTWFASKYSAMSAQESAILEIDFAPSNRFDNFYFRPRLVEYFASAVRADKSFFKGVARDFFLAFEAFVCCHGYLL